MTGKDIRLKRLFSKGNAVIVAADHGEFDGPLPGMINLPKVLAEGINPEVDAVLLSPGMTMHCAEIFGTRGGPLAVMRINWSSVYIFHWGYNEGASAQTISVEDALVRGADIVLASLTLYTGSEDRDARNIELFCKLTNEAHRLGVPVIGEFFPPRCNELAPEEMHDQICTGARMLAELGADLIKTFYTHKFTDVTASCPIPILALGAEKTPTQLLALELAEREIAGGARGVVFGRNALQVSDPAHFQSALCAVVREGMTAKEAVSRFGLTD